MKKHYIEKFWEYSNDELKDIISGRFRDASDDEVAAAIELLKNRSERPLDKQVNLSLAQIPSATMPVLLEIIKNPEYWGTDAVEIAEAEILRRDQDPSEGKPNTNKTLGQVILGILGILVSVILTKLITSIFIFAVLIYCVISCLNDL